MTAPKRKETKIVVLEDDGATYEYMNSEGPMELVDKISACDSSVQFVTFRDSARKMYRTHLVRNIKMIEFHELEEGEKQSG